MAGWKAGADRNFLAKFNLLWWKIGTVGWRRADFSRWAARLCGARQDSHLASILSAPFATNADFFITYVKLLAFWQPAGLLNTENEENWSSALMLFTSPPLHAAQLSLICRQLHLTVIQPETLDSCLVLAKRPAVWWIELMAHWNIHKISLYA